jgi:hypothetical protein
VSNNTEKIESDVALCSSTGQGRGRIEFGKNRFGLLDDGLRQTSDSGCVQAARVSRNAVR